MILTDEEILKATGWDYLSGDELILIRQANGAQLKKTVEWGNEKCYEHNKEGRDRLEKQTGFRIERHTCWPCWQSLLDEVKE